MALAGRSSTCFSVRPWPPGQDLLEQCFWASWPRNTSLGQLSLLGLPAVPLSLVTRVLSDLLLFPP